MRLPETWIETTVRSVVTDLQPGFAQKPGEEDEGTTPQIRTHNVTADGKISRNRSANPPCPAQPLMTPA